MFAVDGLVNTSMPCARRIATSILVVVDLPLEPDTTTRPWGKPDRVRFRYFGAMRLTTRPGTADPPPGLRSRAANRVSLPTRIAGA